MADNNITFAKIVANPSASAWSQAYNAGKLFAVISLEKETEETEKDYLNILGKEILDTLEQEFFTLEEKNLESIKQAVTITSEKIPSDVSCSFVIATYIENVLYLYLLGGGKISLKREDKLGILLQSEENDPKVLKDASGYLQTGDVIILQTKQFGKIITTQVLNEFVNESPPADIAEHIAPLIHEKDESAAAGIIINYKAQPNEQEQKEPEILAEEKLIEEDEEEAKQQPSPFYSPSVNTQRQRRGISFLSGFISLLKPEGRSHLTHPRKIILTIIVIILAVFIISVVFAVKKQQDSKTLAVFQSVYPQATKKYEEGKSLLGLNEGLAQDSFNQAKKILVDNLNKLPKNSDEQKKLQTLLDEVNQQLGNAPKPNAVNAKEVESTNSNLLNAEAKNSATHYTIDANNIYMLTGSAIYSLKLDGSNKNSIITNDSDWTSPAGFSTYFGNLYVLDKKENQILKFVEGDSSYSKSNYFSDTNGINFSKAVSMAIDSSVYVLFQDGKIEKFNKGASESFTLSGLDKDLSGPTKVFTTADNDFLYVLDNGNSRIIVLEKSGKYKAQYQASQIKSAKDFDIDEKNSKAYILSQGKVYELELK